MNESKEERAKRFFCDLPEETQRWLCKLSDDDIVAMKELVKSFRKAATIGSFMKWMITGTLAIFMSVIAFNEYIKKILAWFTH